MAKEATNPKPSMPREWYCLAVHKDTHERTFEDMGAEKQTVQLMIESWEVWTYSLISSLAGLQYSPNEA